MSAVNEGDTVLPKTPKAHAKHGRGSGCGCWTGEGASVECSHCGASYRPAEVVEFSRWTCYGCGHGASPPWRLFNKDPRRAFMREIMNDFRKEGSE